jgi:hypothetical protein
MAYETCEIMFSDLNEEGKAKVLKHYKISSPEDMQFDVFPIENISTWYSSK